jgi:hypothetical protein
MDAYLQFAQRKWPTAADTISGGGRYGLVGCGFLLLFETKQKRANVLARWDAPNGSCGPGCKGNHRLLDLPEIQAEWSSDRLETCHA